MKTPPFFTFAPPPPIIAPPPPPNAPAPDVAAAAIADPVADSVPFLYPTSCYVILCYVSFSVKKEAKKRGQVGLCKVR